MCEIVSIVSVYMYVHASWREAPLAMLSHCLFIFRRRTPRRDEAPLSSHRRGAKPRKGKGASMNKSKCLRIRLGGGGGVIMHSKCTKLLFLSDSHVSVTNDRHHMEEKKHKLY